MKKTNSLGSESIPNVKNKNFRTRVLFSDDPLQNSRQLSGLFERLQVERLQLHALRLRELHDIGREFAKYFPQISLRAWAKLDCPCVRRGPPLSSRVRITKRQQWS